MTYLETIGKNAKKAFEDLKSVNHNKIKKVLENYNYSLLKNKKRIIKENFKDVKNVQRKHLVDRLMLNDRRIEGIRYSINQISKFKKGQKIVVATNAYPNKEFEAEISFIKLASYKGTSSTGNVITAIGLEEDLSNRHVVIIEDIIDTGKTLNSFMQELKNRSPKSIKIASFLTKPSALQYPIVADYIGFEIPNKFVVGYGLDYDGLGRNIPALYQLSE